MQLPESFKQKPILSMSSLHIAKMTGKRHDHVLRDIRNMFNELGNEPKFGEVKYLDGKGELRPMYELDEAETLCLVTKYDTVKRMAIIKQWQAMRDYFLQKQKQEALRIESRKESKHVRRAETDSIKQLVEYATNLGSKNASNYYTNITKLVYKVLGFEVGTRDFMTVDQLKQLSVAETVADLAIRQGIASNLDYHDIYQLVKVRVNALGVVLLNNKLN